MSELTHGPIPVIAFTMPTNRLTYESSPYLKQHENNPVDWYAWGEEALARASTEDKPILLSIGYSACHWCHVMAHECFENEAIARQMNENFINIKVDREERPDLDHIYQNVAQAMTRSGGWPLTVFLTPDLLPIFGGTYFPPEDRYGRPGFPKVLAALSDAYKSDRAGIAENSKKLTDFILQAETVEHAGPLQPSREALTKILDRYLMQVDWENGGIGSAPKFPNVMTLNYFWRAGFLWNHAQAKEAAVLSLTQMAMGGIYDHLGGGFSRYSVDEHWAVPHFEKMLYDNALLLSAYSEVLMADGKNGPAILSPSQRALFLDVIGNTVNYVLREMTAPSGGFYAAQDADSEGVEGKFFVWTPESIRSVLSEEDSKLFEKRYGVTETGNFEHAQTVLSISTPLVNESEKARVENARLKLFRARTQRVAPGLDHKSLTSWNGLMVSGLIQAGLALRFEGSQYLGDRALRAAERAFFFVTHQVVQTNPARLFSTFQNGQAKFNAYLDDYAFMTRAAIDLLKSPLIKDKERVETLNFAKTWTESVIKHFKDPTGPGFFFTSDDHEKLIHRTKSVFDQAIPSGTAIVLQNLLSLGDLKKAHEYLAELFPLLERSPHGMAELACAALKSFYGLISIQGPIEKATNLFFHAHIEASTSGEIPANNAWVICQNQTCDLPSTDLAIVLEKTCKRLVG